MRTCEIAIYTDIGSAVGEYGPEALRRDLKAAGTVSEIHLRLNSQGGNVVDGLAMFNILRQHPARKVVTVDGMALSIASIVAMAGDEIIVPENAWLMVHHPHNSVSGTPTDLRAMAGLLEDMGTQLANIYAARTRRPLSEIRKLMDAETWLTGKDAVRAGFADRTTPALAMAAQFDSSKFRNAPRQDSPAALTFLSAVALNQARGMSRQNAVRDVAIKHPDLHQRYITAVNAGRTR